MPSTSSVASFKCPFRADRMAGDGEHSGNEQCDTAGSEEQSRDPFTFPFSLAEVGAVCSCLCLKRSPISVSFFLLFFLELFLTAPSMWQGILGKLLSAESLTCTPGTHATSAEQGSSAAGCWAPSSSRTMLLLFVLPFDVECQSSFFKDEKIPLWSPVHVSSTCRQGSQSWHCSHMSLHYRGISALTTSCYGPTSVTSPIAQLHWITVDSMDKHTWWDKSKVNKYQSGCASGHEHAIRTGSNETAIYIHIRHFTLWLQGHIVHNSQNHISVVTQTECRSDWGMATKQDKGWYRIWRDTPWAVKKGAKACSYYSLNVHGMCGQSNYITS